MDDKIIDIEEVKRRAQAGVGPEGAPKEEAPQPPFSVKFLPNGIFEMRCDLKHAVLNEDKMHLFRGFMDNTRDRAMAFIMDQQVKLAEQTQKIVSLKNGGKPGFMDGLAGFLKKK